MNRWPVVKLQEVAFYQEGPGLRNWQWAVGGIKVINGTNIREDGHFDPSNTDKFVSWAEFESKYRHFQINSGDIVVSSSGTIGKVAIVESQHLPMMMNTSVIRFRSGDRARLDDSFLYSWLRSPEFKKQAESYAQGAAQRNFGPTHIKLMTLALPPMHEQRRIASILGAYDDLIEVNRRRIAVLEEMARRLFEEWFVRRLVPGHDAAQAWANAEVAELIDFDPPTRLPRSGIKPFIPMTHLSTSTSLIDSPEERESGSGAKFKNGDTLFARITPCLENGKTGLVRDLPGDGVGFGSTEYIVMRGRLAGPAFTYLLARHAAFRAHAQKSMSGATGRQRARTESLKSFEFPRPPVELLELFEAHAWPMLELVGQLGEANKRLAASRDLLLPRLISGELEVKAAEQALEAVA